jgi:DNA-binding PadR family transcriptional regulator
MKKTNNFLGEFEEFVLLAIIKLGRDRAYGVPIAEAIEEASGKRVSTGALYTTLMRLEEKGFISSYMGDATAERGGRAKKYFEIKNNGRQTLQNSFNVKRNLGADLIIAWV